MSDKTPSSTFVVRTEPAKGVITPFAIAKMSEDLFLCSSNYNTPGRRFPLVSYFLYSASIELALKASILGVDCTQAQKDYLKSKVGHDLNRLVSYHEKITSETLLSDSEKESLLKINKYFRNKGLEYFTTDMLVEALGAYKNLPPIQEIKRIGYKLNKHLAKHKYFIAAPTSDQPRGGIISFY